VPACLCALPGSATAIDAPDELVTIR